jgi:hypothetical protein
LAKKDWEVCVQQFLAINSSTEMTSMIPTQKTKCASRAQMLGFAPYDTCALGKSASHKIDKVRTWLAKCASTSVKPHSVLTPHSVLELLFYLITCLI